MKPYTVQINVVKTYTIEVEAENAQAAEEIALAMQTTAIESCGSLREVSTDFAQACEA